MSVSRQRRELNRGRTVWRRRPDHMSAPAVVILRTGLMTSVGGDAPSSCAAIRSKLTNPVPSEFMDSTGAWITVHRVCVAGIENGLSKLTGMAAAVAEEALR